MAAAALRHGDADGRRPVLPAGKVLVLYCVPVLGGALISGQGLSVITMTWTFLLVLIVPAYSNGPFGATWTFDADHVQVYLNLFTLSFATLLTGRTISDLRLESSQRERTAKALRIKE